MDEADLSRLVAYYQQKHADEVLKNGQLIVQLEKTQAELETLKLDQATAEADAPA